MPGDRDSGDAADGGERTSGGDGETLAPAEAFELLGNEVRLGIVRELAAVRRSNWQWQGRTFASLRRAVGVADAGNFNYHLDKLRGHFVVKDGDEYKLTYAGMQVAGAVVAGTYTDRGDPRTATLDVPCVECGDPLRLAYEREFLAVECDEHGIQFGTSLPPGAAAGRSTDELVRLATLDARQDVERARSGVCPHCWGAIEPTLPTDTVLDAVTGDREPVRPGEPWAEFECDRCGVVFWLPATACVVNEPSVVAIATASGSTLTRASCQSASRTTPPTFAGYLVRRVSRPTSAP